MSTEYGEHRGQPKSGGYRRKHNKKLQNNEKQL